MNEIYKLSGFQQELDKAERFFSMHLTRQELKSRLDEIERLNNIIKEVREIFKDYGEKEDIVGYSMYNITGEMLLKLLEILDKGE